MRCTSEMMRIANILAGDGDLCDDTIETAIAAADRRLDSLGGNGNVVPFDLYRVRRILALAIRLRRAGSERG